MMMDLEIGLQVKPQAAMAIGPLPLHLQFDPSIFGRNPPSQISPDKASI
jgi:hypothetical protein